MHPRCRVICSDLTRFLTLLQKVACKIITWTKHHIKYFLNCQRDSHIILPATFRHEKKRPLCLGSCVCVNIKSKFSGLFPLSRSSGEQTGAKGRKPKLQTSWITFQPGVHGHLLASAVPRLAPAFAQLWTKINGGTLRWSLTLKRADKWLQISLEARRDGWNDVVVTW